MCGIVGAFGEDSVDVLRPAVERGLEATRHRGPDQTGSVAIPLGGGNLVLGFNRLAILDLTEASAQPMPDAAARSWLAFNGEIYNFAELRADLERAGCAFRSSGDTEVLLQALLVWGPRALSRVRGMYAFAFWNGAERRLLLGRDPFGIKPLLIGRSGRTIVFASELKAIHASRLIPLTLDRGALGSYLAYGATAEPETIAAQVKPLPPGHVAEIDAEGRLSPPRALNPIAELLLADTGERLGAHEVEDGAGHALARAVESHLVSDVAVGVCLSGGIDSYLVARLAARSSAAEALHFLTIDCAESGFSELAGARQAARGLPGQHHVVTLTSAEALAELPAFLSAMDQPTVDGFNSFAISGAAAARGIKVLLSGLGGDELFGGYTTFQKVPFMARHSSWLAPLARARLRLSSGAGPQWHKLARSRRVGIAGAYLLQRAIRWQGLPFSDWRGPLPPGDVGIPAEAYDRLLAGGSGDPYQQIALLEISTYLRNQLLRDADVFSSARSIELRVPFLDLPLARIAFRMPASRHVGAFGPRKRVLRSLVGRDRNGYQLPKVKHGFVMPWQAWLRGALLGQVRDAFADRGSLEDLGLDPRGADRLLTGFLAGDPLATWFQVWSLYVLLQWQQRWRLGA